MRDETDTTPADTKATRDTSISVQLSPQILQTTVHFCKDNLPSCLSRNVETHGSQQADAMEDEGVSLNVENSDEENESNFTRRASLNVPLDIRKHYGTHYNTHILLVDEISYPTEMHRRENSELHESEVQSMHSLSMSNTDTDEEGNERGRELHMIEMMPKSEQDENNELNVTVDEFATNAAASLQNSEDDGNNIIRKPDDHMILVLLSMLCCNPILGTAALLTSSEFISSH